MDAGKRLAHYEILAPIGKGGMGEVWRARDTKLDREVAIKTLPSDFAEDAGRLSRFEREAKLLAALNHPNIAGIHGLEESDGVKALVLELVEGETLAERIAARPIPVEEAIALALQIAEALEGAHDKGVIHRDLKPANVKITPEGKIKVLDFGLAKALEGDSSDQNLSVSPTLSRAATQAGVILGTAPYMSPEQAKGRAVDKRTDMWAFGAVLYEMLTGKGAFAGDDVSEVLAAVIRAEPDWGHLPSSLHPRLRELLKRCLSKDRTERYHDMGDVRLDLQVVLDDPRGVLVEERAGSVPASPTSKLPWVAAIVSSVLIAGLVAWNLKPSEPAALTRLSVTLPDLYAFEALPSPNSSLALSPDGRRIVYVGYVERGVAGERRLYMRSLDELTVTPIAGTEGAAQPFFSPDGSWVFFFTPLGELKKIRLDGSAPVTLLKDLASGLWRFGAFRDEDTIVFDTVDGVAEISAEGGTPTPLSLPTGSEPRSLRFPVPVPDTGDLLFASVGGSTQIDPRIELFEQGSNERVTILENALLVGLTASHHLLFVKDEVLMAASFDPRADALGPAVPLSESMARDGSIRPQLAVAPVGTLAYVLAPDEPSAPTLGWVSRTGEFSPLVTLPVGFRTVQLSPDGRTALVTDGVTRALRIDLSRGIPMRVDVGTERIFSARWHPDGRRAALGGDALRLLDLDSGEEEILVDDVRAVRTPSFTRDGATVAFNMEAEENLGQSIYALLPGETEPRPIVASNRLEHSPALSPDGRWIAYVTDESGEAQVYVAGFPENDDRQQLTVNRGWEPFWSRDGRELFFTEGGVRSERVLRVVSVSSGDRLELGEPSTLFDLNDLAASANFAWGSNSGPAHDIAPDGERFLMIRQPAAPPATEIIIVENWLDELERLVP